MRYFLELCFKGTRYNGWQIQRNAPSVQDTFQKALSSILGQEIRLTGAGRTDTGVHASKYFAHFDTLSEIVDPMHTCRSLNLMLPPDMAAKRIFKVSDHAHARFDALSREYTYHMLSVKDPFTRETTWQYYVPLDVEAMNRAAASLLRFDDFTSFAKLNSANKTNICNVTFAEWHKTENGQTFVIRSNRFLRNMVRAIVGTLVDVGRGKITPDRFHDIIAARDLSLSSSSAPAQGLFLTDVSYPDEILSPDDNVG